MKIGEFKVFRTRQIAQSPHHSGCRREGAMMLLSFFCPTLIFPLPSSRVTFSGEHCLLGETEAAEAR